MAPDRAMSEFEKRLAHGPQPHVFALLVMLLLAGCGNAYEKLELGAWQSVGSKELPPGEKLLKRELLNMTIADTGRGRVVGPGSMVLIRVEALTGHFLDEETKYPIRDVEAWVWIGSIRLLRREGIGGNATRDMPLGSALLRELLVGLHEGGVISVSRGASQLDVLQIPLRGFLLHFSLSFSGDGMEDSEYVSIAEKGEYKITIQKVCTGKPSHKKAIMRQWGYVFNWGDMHYRIAREGTLEWLAIDVDCDRGEQLRFEKGPSYGPFTPGFDSPLLGWKQSYVALASGDPQLKAAEGLHKAMFRAGSEMRYKQSWAKNIKGARPGQGGARTFTISLDPPSLYNDNGPDWRSKWHRQICATPDLKAVLDFDGRIVLLSPDMRAPLTPDKLAFFTKADCPR